MPEGEPFKWVIQLGAVGALYVVVRWVVKFVERVLNEKEARIVALEGKLTEKDQVIAALMGELKANIRAQEVATQQQAQASELVDPALFDRIMRGIQDGIKKSLKGAR